MGFIPSSVWNNFLKIPSSVEMDLLLQRNCWMRSKLLLAGEWFMHRLEMILVEMVACLHGLVLLVPLPNKEIAKLWQNCHYNLLIIVHRLTHLVFIWVGTVCKLIWFRCWFAMHVYIQTHKYIAFGL